MNLSKLALSYLPKAASLQSGLHVPSSGLGPVPSLQGFFRTVSLLWLTLAWKSLAAAVSWILSCSDHALVTGAKEQEEDKQKQREAMEKVGFEHV